MRVEPADSVLRHVDATSIRHRLTLTIREEARSSSLSEIRLAGHLEGTFATLLDNEVILDCSEIQQRFLFDCLLRIGLLKLGRRQTVVRLRIRLVNTRMILLLSNSRDAPLGRFIKSTRGRRLLIHFTI